MICCWFIEGFPELQERKSEIWHLSIKSKYFLLNKNMAVLALAKLWWFALLIQTFCLLWWCTTNVLVEKHHLVTWFVITESSVHSQWAVEVSKNVKPVDTSRPFHLVPPPWPRSGWFPPRLLERWTVCRRRCTRVKSLELLQVCLMVTWHVDAIQSSSDHPHHQLFLWGSKHQHQQYVYGDSHSSRSQLCTRALDREQPSPVALDPTPFGKSSTCSTSYTLSVVSCIDWLIKKPFIK